MIHAYRILSIAALAAVGGFAQFPTGIPGLGGRMPGGRNGGQQPGGGQPRGDSTRPVTVEEREKKQFEEFARDLSLNSSQKKKVKTILEDARVSAESVQSEISNAREAVVRAVRDGKGDEDLDKLTDEQGKVYARLAAIEAMAFRRIFAVLDDSQKTRAEDVLPRSIGRFVTREEAPRRGFGGSGLSE